MMETLWMAGLVIAQLWGANSLGVFESAEPRLIVVPEKSALVGAGVGALLGERIEERLADERTPIRPPIKPGERPLCETPPSNEEILRAMPTFARGIPFVYDQYREELEFTVEKLVDKVDAPRFFPLIGPAQLHHCHWKCTVYYTEVVEVTHPYAFKTRSKKAEVIYIDKDFLHLCMQPKTDDTEASELPKTCPGGHFSPSPKTAAPNSRKVYVIVEGNGNGQQVIALPADNQTVIDAVGNVKSLSCDSVQKVWVTRPITGSGNAKVIPVNWKEITQSHGNFQLIPGDRVYVNLESKVYVVIDAGANGQQVTALPCHELTVLDVVAKVSAGHIRKVCVVRLDASGKDGTATLPVDWKALTREGQTATNYLLEPGDRVQVFIDPPAPAKLVEVVAYKAPSLTIDDIVKMSKAGASPKVIMRQMELTGAVFSLSAADIVHLCEQGVPSRVISAMQERRAAEAKTDAENLRRAWRGEPLLESQWLPPVVPVPAPPAGVNVEEQQEPPTAKAKAPYSERYSTEGYPDIAYETPKQIKEREDSKKPQVYPDPRARFAEPPLAEKKKASAELSVKWSEDIRSAEDVLNKGKYLTGVGGQIKLVGPDSKQSIAANGTVFVEMYEAATDKKVAEWQFDRESLRALNNAGTYTLFLPLENAREMRVQLRVLYMPEDGGQPVHGEPNVIELQERIILGHQPPIPGR